MNNQNKLIGALLVSALTMSSTLPSQYTIESFSVAKKALGIGVLAGLTVYGTYKYWKGCNATDESDETASNMQQARDTVAAGLQCVADTVRTHPGTTVATLTGMAALAGGVCAYYNGYVPSNFDDLMESGYKVVKATIKSDLTIGELVQDSSTCSAWSQNNFFRKLLKASRIGGCCFIADTCIAFVGPRSSPDARQHNIQPSWAAAVIVCPVIEELLFTGGGSLLFKDYAQIVVPPLFAGLHLVGETSQDTSMKLRMLLSSGMGNFVHHRVVRQNLRSEFPVVVISHMVHNQLILAFNALQEKRMENSAPPIAKT